MRRRNNVTAYSRNDDSFSDWDSRWEDRTEFLKSLKKLDLNNMVSDGLSGGVPLYSNGDIAYVENTDCHSLIIGATGSKKTRLIAMPTLQILAKAGESFVATDPKGELYNRTYNTLNENGYKTLVINLRNPSTGNCWNPLELPYKLSTSDDPIERDKARELLDDLARNIIPSTNERDPFWENSAQDFLLGLFELLFRNHTCVEEINLRSVCLLRAQAMSNELIKRNYYGEIDPNSFEYICLSGTVEAPDNTRRSILSVFDQHTRIFSSQNALIQLLSSNQIDFSMLGKEKIALFLILPDEKTTYHKLVSIFIKQCYEQLILEAQKSTNKLLARRVNFVLDEFSSLPTIRDFSAMITAARSRNIRFNLIMQSENQLRTRYGHSEAQTIKGNCSNWLFLTSRELPLLEEISKLAGEKTRYVPLISVSTLQRLSKERGQVLVFHGRSYPYVSTLADISKYSDCADESVEIPVKPRENRELKFFSFMELNNSLVKKRSKGRLDSKNDGNSLEDNLVSNDVKKVEIKNYVDGTFNINAVDDVIFKKYPFPNKYHDKNETGYEFILVKRGEKILLTDQGRTVKMLDEIFELDKPDVIKNLAAILKDHNVRKTGQELVLEIFPWSENTNEKENEELNIALFKMFSCVSFMDSMRIFYE
jgi:type IV secretion system protein VirD4